MLCWVGIDDGICKAPNRIYLVLEYCAGGDLAAYIQRYGRVSEATARHFMRQLGRGFVTLSRKAAHLNLSNAYLQPFQRMRRHVELKVLL